MKVLDILAGLLDSRFEAVRNAAGDALVELTGVRRYYRTASDARQALAPYATDLAGRLRAHGKRERGEIKERRAQADRRLAEALR